MASRCTTRYTRGASHFNTEAADSPRWVFARLLIVSILQGDLNASFRLTHRSV